MRISDWPDDERPREKLLARGSQALSEAELLAVILRTGMRGKSAVAVARELIDRFQGLGNLLHADAQALQRSPGLGPAKAAQLVAVLALVKRALREQMRRGDNIDSPHAARDYLRLHLAARDREVFAAMYLDAQHRVIAVEELFAGTLTQTSVFPREVVRYALLHNCAAVIFAHNHPSGVAEPSRADELLTQTLKRALALVDIKVLDHVVIGAEAALSFSERGLL